MFLSKKLKRSKLTREEADAIIKKAEDEEPLELEKGDLKAIILATIIVFVPFLLAIGGGMLLLWLFIFRVWAS